MSRNTPDFAPRKTAASKKNSFVHILLQKMLVIFAFMCYNVE